MVAFLNFRRCLYLLSGVRYSDFIDIFYPQGDSSMLKSSKTLLVQSLRCFNLPDCNPIQDTVLQKVTKVTDLLLLKENIHNSIFTYNELSSMIELLCTE